MAVLTVFEADPSLRDVGFDELALLDGVRFEDAIGGYAALVQGFGVLDVDYVLAEDDGSVPLERKAVAAAQRDGFLTQPRTGARIEDWEDVVVPIINPSPLLVAALAAAGDPARRP